MTRKKIVTVLKVANNIFWNDSVHFGGNQSFFAYDMTYWGRLMHCFVNNFPFVKKSTLLEINAKSHWVVNTDIFVTLLRLVFCNTCGRTETECVKKGCWEQNNNRNQNEKTEGYLSLHLKKILTHPPRDLKRTCAAKYISFSSSNKKG